MLDTSSKEKKSVLKVIFSKRMWLCMMLGFSSGMPLFVITALLLAYLRVENVDLKSIGLFSLIMFPYTWKFLWSPLVDRYNLFKLGRRKSWMLLSQIIIFVSICLLGQFSATQSLTQIAIIAAILSFSSATQDTVVDAMRREFLSDNEMGLGNSIFVAAYRVAGLIPGSLSLILADFLSWDLVFFITALFMIPSIILSIFYKEQENYNQPRTLKESIVEPFKEFINRCGKKEFFLIILFVFMYKLGDSMATALATPFYIDLGYDLTTIGIVAKTAGLWSMIIGGLLGGIIMLKTGINKALWYFGFAQLITILGFYLLAIKGHDAPPSVILFALVIVAEFLGAGLGTAAFVSFIASKTNKAYTATQLALFTSLSAIPRTFCNATTGYLVKYLGWDNFFLLCTVLAIPGMLLLLKVAPFKNKTENS